LHYLALRLDSMQAVLQGAHFADLSIDVSQKEIYLYLMSSIQDDARRMILIYF